MSASWSEPEHGPETYIPLRHDAHIARNMAILADAQRRLRESGTAVRFYRIDFTRPDDAKPFPSTTRLTTLAGAFDWALETLDRPDPRAIGPIREGFTRANMGERARITLSHPELGGSTVVTVPRA